MINWLLDVFSEHVGGAAPPPRPAGGGGAQPPVGV